MEELSRCSWPGADPLMVKYHDEEWGVPCFDEQKLFEYIVLDSFQAGLSWTIILNKREGFRLAFDNFDPKLIALYGLERRRELEDNPAIIRNKLKIQATITNAQAFLKIQQEFGSFSSYLWRFVYNAPIDHRHKKDSDIGATSPEAIALSADLKKRGFKFVGPTICYAFMQGAGLINDHLVGCYRHLAVQTLSEKRNGGIINS